MPAGLLEVRGTIDVSQFWPSGRSDADTATVMLARAGDPIKFQKDHAAPLRATHVFDDVFVQGRQGRKEAIKNGHVTIRMQGIDAAEQHFQPTALSGAEKENSNQREKDAFHELNHPYRQPLGATSTNELHDFLGKPGTTFDCRVFTQVDKPSEVFDTFGRLVGDIEIAKDHSTVNLNHWLIEQGWAFPTYYSSMTNEEITAIDALAKSAQSKERGVWKFLSKTVGTFDFDLREPKKNDLSVLANDRGPVLFPKLYRRFTSWSARHKAKVTDMPFQKFLAGGVAGKPDDCFETKDFLANGVHSATRHTFDQFVQSGKTIHFEPGGLVFSEAPSKLVKLDHSDVLDEF
jgi:endonuclease YncB( thermonuclease family)